jgi:hypothetical protein
MAANRCVDSVWRYDVPAPKNQKALAKDHLIEQDRWETTWLWEVASSMGCNVSAHPRCSQMFHNGGHTAMDELFALREANTEGRQKGILGGTPVQIHRLSQPPMQRSDRLVAQQEAAGTCRQDV